VTPHRTRVPRRRPGLGILLPEGSPGLRASGRPARLRFPLLREVGRINDEAVEAAFGKIKDALWNLENKRIAMLGLSFMPDTDDVRFSPALALGRRLLGEGATVVGYDPRA
jgi:UDPglucose 6-dehydrogenase